MIELDIANIIKQYENGISASKLARENSVSVWTILNRLRSKDVSIRTFVEQNKKRLNLNNVNNEKFLEIIDGLMLGDGNIHKKKKYIQISQNGSNVSWLFKLKEIFANIGVNCTITKYDARIRTIGERNIYSKPGAVLFTPAYEELREQQARWFPNGNKKIPLDVRITPLSVALWFCGDGSNNKKGQITFYSNSFSKKENELLINMLHYNLNIHPTISKHKRKCEISKKIKTEYVINITKRNDAFVLKNLIQEFIPECFQYKLINIRKSRKGEPRGKLSTEQIIEIRNLNKQGKSYFQIAKQFNRSPSAIYHIMKGHTYKHIK